VNFPTFLFLAVAAASPITPVVRDAVSSPHATMSELGREVPPVIPLNEEREQRRSYRPQVAGIAGKTTVHIESTVTQPTLAAPRVTAGFAASRELLGRIPSDAAGAVSSKYLLHVSNSSVVAQDRAGVVLSKVSLSSFWHDSAYPDAEVFDTRVLYDGVADRWILCTLYDQNFHKSALLIAVSDGGNPSLGWHRYRYIVDAAFDDLDADYTRMAQTRDSIAITANLFGSIDMFAGIFTIRKSDAYSGAATLPVSQLNKFAYFDLVPVDGPESTQLYLVGAYSGGIALSSYNAGTLVTITAATAPANTAQAFDAVGLQRGSTIKLDCGFTTVHNAVLKNGTIWVASQVDRSSPLRSSVLWWRILVGNPAHVDTGLIDDPTGATMYAFPSIAVNKFGAALIGYCVFNASLYPSAGYSYIDPFNSLSAPALLKTGDGPSFTSRWADYSTTIVDSNDIDFWTNQTYAPVLSTGGAWGTWWNKVDMPAAPRGRAVHH
jgi:hypothetical protein